MELSTTAEDFTFAGVEQNLTNGLVTIVSAATVVGLILILILEISLGWNYFKLLLETVERDRKSTRLNSSHIEESRMPSSA